ncbi:MAG: hypothetical protein R3A79_22690 [Nannocystaceae bacterium]
MRRTSTIARPTLVAALTLATSACGSLRGDDCESTRDYYTNEVWGPVMSKSCISCHRPDGAAAEQNADFILLPSSYPGFLDANYAEIQRIAGNQYNGVPLLLAKPTGQVEHGGGVLFDAKSDQYEAIEGFLAQLEDPVECPTGSDAADFAKVDELDAEATLRKAALHLVGRLPSASEYERVKEGGDDELEVILREMMTEDAFYDRLVDLYNDVFLTDRYLRYTGFAVNLLNQEDFPNAGAWYEGQSDAMREAINLAVAREPLDLIAYVVRNDRPFTEILTAPYMVFSPFSAELYGVSPGFSDPSDPRELKEGTLTVDFDGAGVPYPHAGVLTSPMVLNRMPTTPTNRNRHRARRVLELFLATDILRIAERPIDPTQATNYNNPTRDDPSCVVCHKVIDPIAGAFQKFGEYDQEELIPDQEWHQDMYAPGFGDEVMPVDAYSSAPQWLAARIVDDPRFPLSTVYTIFTGLTGLAPLAYPADDDPDFKDKLAAWQAQDALLGAVADRFVADDYDLKTVVAGVVMSPYFRGRNATEELSAGEQLRLAAVGGGRLSTPGLLARKIAAVTGASWYRRWDFAEYLLTDYRVLYGGIDSDAITTRLTSMSGLMAGVSARMANEVACGVTGWDFTKAPEERALFPFVDLDTMPETAGGDAIPGAQDDIRANIQYLHERVLGERLELDDPEIDRTYALFVDLWKAGYADVQGGAENDWLVWSCQGRADPASDYELPEGERINTDANYTVRAWMGVMIYLLSDYRFLYE